MSTEDIIGWIVVYGVVAFFTFVFGCSIRFQETDNQLRRFDGRGPIQEEGNYKKRGARIMLGAFVWPLFVPLFLLFWLVYGVVTIVKDAFSKD